MPSPEKQNEQNPTEGLLQNLLKNFDYSAGKNSVPSQTNLSEYYQNEEDKQEQGAKVDNKSVLGKTLEGLVPALATALITGGAAAAGVRGQNLVATAKLASDVSGAGYGAYKSNQEKARYELASHLVDQYIDQGITDPNMIYKKFRQDNPDLYSKIDPGKLYDIKASEQSKIIDMSNESYKSQAIQDQAYEASKDTVYKSGGYLKAPTVRHSDFDGHKDNYDNLTQYLVKNFDGKFTKQGDKYIFADPQDYTDFLNMFGGETYKDANGISSKFDLNQANKFIEVDGDNPALIKAQAYKEWLASRKGGKPNRGVGKIDDIVSYQNSLKTELGLDKDFESSELTRAAGLVREYDIENKARISRGEDAPTEKEKRLLSELSEAKLKIKEKTTNKKTNILDSLLTSQDKVTGAVADVFALKDQLQAKSLGKKKIQGKEYEVFQDKDGKKFVIDKGKKREVK